MLQKHFIYIVAAACLLLLPSLAFAQDPPQISQGQFAVQLIGSFRLGSSANAEEAEKMLGAVGIAPKDGWRTEAPMTSQIAGEVYDSILSSLDSGTFRAPQDSVMRAFENVTAANGLYPQAPPDQYAAGPPVIVNNYYYPMGAPDYPYYYGLGGYGYGYGGGYGYYPLGPGYMFDRRFHNGGIMNRPLVPNPVPGVAPRIWNNMSPTQNRAWSFYGRPGVNMNRGGAYGTMGMRGGRR